MRATQRRGAATRASVLLLGLVLTLTTLAATPARAAVTFIDVPVGTQFRTEITWLAERGISTGWDTPRGKEYRPLQAINRDAMAAFLYRYAGKPAFDEPKVSPFVDLKPTDQFYKEITWAADRGITTGWARKDGKREYRPMSPINRDAMAAFLYRFEGNPSWTAPARSPFSDLGAGVQFYREMTWLAAKGVTTGWDQTAALPQYRPVQPINRDAMAAFLYRLEVTKRGPHLTPAPNAAHDVAVVGTMPTTFDRRLQDGDYPDRLMQDLWLLGFCRNDDPPFRTINQRVASWGKDYWGEEAGGSDLSIIFSSTGSAMAFMAEARANAWCPTFSFPDRPGEYEVTAYWRPADAAWDEALAVGKEWRLRNGQTNETPMGRQWLFARKGNKVVVSWSSIWYSPGIGPDNWGLEESNREEVVRRLQQLG